MRNKTISSADKRKADVIKNIVTSASRKAEISIPSTRKHKLTINEKNYVWSTNREKIGVIRKGLPYAAIEHISKRTNIPVKHYLESLEIVQTTYNKKKKSNAGLSKQDSEFIVELIELYEFGLNVFNNEEEKFQRWLRKRNISLGNSKPESLFDSLAGINEVKKALNRLEYGNMA